MHSFTSEMPVYEDECGLNECIGLFSHFTTHILTI